MPSRSLRPLWTCPKCGHRFVSRNLWHSCVRVAIDDHFRGKGPVPRALFRDVRAVIRSIGPAHLYAQKTRIVFQNRARFAGVVVRRQWIEIGLWLKRRAEGTRARRVEYVPPKNWIYHFRVAAPGDLDAEVRQLLREAYRVGNQERF